MKKNKEKVPNSNSLTIRLKPNILNNNFYINVSASVGTKSAVDQPRVELGTFGFQSNILPLNYWPHSNSNNNLNYLNLSII